MNKNPGALYEEIKKNDFCKPKVVLPTVATVGAHFAALFPWNGNWDYMLYVQAPGVDYITHFIGGYAVSQIADTFFETSAYSSLSEKYSVLKKMPKEAFVFGAIVLAGSLNEIFERIATSDIAEEKITPIVGSHIFSAVEKICSESVNNSIKDMFMNMTGFLAQRYASRNIYPQKGTPRLPEGEMTAFQAEDA